MIRHFLSALILLAAASLTEAHFVFVVPEPADRHAKVILSEDLAPDDDVPIHLIADAKLVCTDSAAHDTALTLRDQKTAYEIDLMGSGTRVIHGLADLGVQRRGKSKPFLLIYYPKTVIGDAFDPKTRLGDRAPVELAAVGEPGRMKFQMLAGGKPVGGAEIDLILPDGSKRKVIADANGQTPAFNLPGRYGAWARHFESAPGMRGGNAYAQVHEYATLVIDAPSSSVSAKYAPLPQAASSFGAVACDGWLYVYGGHIVMTHSYSTASVSGRFDRLNLADHHTWQKLPGGPPLQGMNLATYRGKVYRIGGMSPRNKPGEPTDVRSVADCACFDPATHQWTSLATLPQPRSSHDIAVVDGRLIVVGGWTLDGKPGAARWCDTVAILDLSAKNPQWISVRQPFKRRALIAASYRKKMYVIGGFETDDQPTRRVDIYDPRSDGWTKGPDLPGPDRNGFGPAACVLGDRLYVSVADGTLYRLTEAGDGWEKVTATTPRIVHRLAPNDSQILVVGGASKKQQLNLIEAVTVHSFEGDGAATSNAK